MTMNHRTAKPVSTQPPRSGDTTTKAAQRPQGNVKKDEPEGETTTRRAARSADAERSAARETQRQPRRSRGEKRAAERAERASSRPQARKQKEGHDAVKRIEEQDGQRIGKHEGRGAQPRVLLICLSNCSH
jgi:hypothetical protein